MSVIKPTERQVDFFIVLEYLRLCYPESRFPFKPLAQNFQMKTFPTLTSQMMKQLQLNEDSALIKPSYTPLLFKSHILRHDTDGEPKIWPLVDIGSLENTELGKKVAELCARDPIHQNVKAFNELIGGITIHNFAHTAEIAYRFKVFNLSVACACVVYFCDHIGVDIVKQLEEQVEPEVFSYMAKLHILLAPVIHADFMSKRKTKRPLDCPSDPVVCELSCL
jgi:hypothetical protein